MRQDPETVLTVVHAARTSLQKPLTHTAIQSLRHVAPGQSFRGCQTRQQHGDCSTVC